MQTIQHDKNPSGEGAAARVSRAVATPSISTDTAAGWPVLGSKSHKAVATAATICTIGLPNADRPAAAAGQKWSVKLAVRSAQARTIQAAIVFYNTAGATLGTVTGTVPGTATAFAAGDIKTLTIDGALAPAGTASVDLQVSRTAAGSPAISDTFYVDTVAFTRTDTAISYRAPSTDYTAVWSGTVDASTQLYYDSTVTLTPQITGNPWVEVFPVDLPPAVARLRMIRTSEDRTWLVRGGVDVAPGVAAQDFECPLKSTATYRAELYDAAGTRLGYTDSASVVLNVDGTWVHQPLQPLVATQVELDDGSGATLYRETPGELTYVEGASVARRIGSRRRGLTKVPISISAFGVQMDAFQAILGSYEVEQLGVLCIRTSAPVRWPRTFFASSDDLAEQDVSVKVGGAYVQFIGTLTEVEPPHPGLVMPLLRYDDLDAFGDYAAQDAGWATYTDRDRAYALAGLAG
ncbi:hypothetical protein ACFVTX_18220 [Agromyces sp. NPDC058136]|uniref:hypothetical protein n=1 Tax=Agromyces sp. NPDC058136 TaxID=3346354 RepID=UPI0036D7DAE2